MTVPLCLLCLDFLLHKQQKTQKTTNNPPLVHLFYGEPFEMVQYMICRLFLWVRKYFCYLLWASPHKRVLPFCLRRKAPETNSIHLSHLFQCSRGYTPSCNSRLCLNTLYLSFSLLMSSIA